MVQRVLGFDFGMKYIGIAIGQTITNTATPLTSIKAKDGIPKWADIGALIVDWQPDLLIVGSPLNMDGTAQHLTHCAHKFARRLQQRFKLPVELVDERLSTWEAKQHVSDLVQVNATAAAILVEQWLIS